MVSVSDFQAIALDGSLVIEGFLHTLFNFFFKLKITAMNYLLYFITPSPQNWLLPYIMIDMLLADFNKWFCGIIT